MGIHRLHSMMMKALRSLCIGSRNLLLTVQW
jgi:hypothetical protein